MSGGSTNVLCPGAGTDRVASVCKESPWETCTTANRRFPVLEPLKRSSPPTTSMTHEKRFRAARRDEE